MEVEERMLDEGKQMQEKGKEVRKGKERSRG